MLKPADAASLATFRVLFGVIMVWEVYRYYTYSRIDRYYIEPKIFFTYELFPFVSPLPGQGMYLVFIIMGGLVLGLFYRVFAPFFCNLHLRFLLDKTQYNNHYYLIILLTFCLLLLMRTAGPLLTKSGVPACGPRLFLFGKFSFSAPKFLLFILSKGINLIFHKQQRIGKIWTLWLESLILPKITVAKKLKLSPCPVYLYAGIAKINIDWLAGDPMRAWLASRSNYAVFGPLFAQEITVYFFTYGGRAD